MIYMARSNKDEVNYNLQVDVFPDVISFTIEDPDDWQSSMAIYITQDDFIKIVRAMASNNELKDYDIIIRNKREGKHDDL